MYKILRRGSSRVFVVCAVLLTLLLCLYYVNQAQAPSTGPSAGILNEELRYDRGLTSITPDYVESPDAKVSLDTCPIIVPRNVDIDTQQEFEKFDFQPSWMRSREYWDDSFEARYAELRKDPTRPPLKVILVPHSHTDPGWLKTFEQYFHSSTRSILNNMVSKLQQWPNMTFIWSEVSFLSLWWERE